MHTRADILKNQKTFSYEIKRWFKSDLNRTKSELFKIDSVDPIILEAKKKLESKSENIKLSKEVSKFIINETNIYPKFYAWWNDGEKIVEIHLYETR